MSLFSRQVVYCRACGAKMFVALSAPRCTEVCGEKCSDELAWRWALSTLGKKYYPHPERGPFRSNSPETDEGPTVCTLNEAVNDCCTCGGAGPGEGCPACEVWHWLMTGKS